MGNSASVVRPSVEPSTVSFAREQSKPHQSFVGVTDLINREIDRIDEAAKSAEGVQGYINDSLRDNSGASSRGAENNIAFSVTKTIGKVCSSLDKTKQRLEQLQSSLDTFSVQVLKQCEETKSDMKDEMTSLVKARLNATANLVVSASERIDKSSDFTSENHQPGWKSVFSRKSRDENDSAERPTTSFTEADRERYEKEMKQMKEIIDTLEDELEALKQESSETETSLDTANERMQKIEEKILEERLAHEVEVNALRAIVERQDEIIKSVSGTNVNDEWLENQKNRLFSMEEDEENMSNETCFDLIYVDQKRIIEEKHRNPIRASKEDIMIKSGENINYDSSSLASTKLPFEEGKSSRNEPSRNADSKFEMKQDLETPSSVILTFPKETEDQNKANDVLEEKQEGKESLPEKTEIHTIQQGIENQPNEITDTGGHTQENDKAFENKIEDNIETVNKDTLYILPDMNRPCSSENTSIRLQEDCKSDEQSEMKPNAKHISVVAQKQKARNKSKTFESNSEDIVPKETVMYKTEDVQVSQKIDETESSKRTQTKPFEKTIADMPNEKAAIHTNGIAKLAQETDESKSSSRTGIDILLKDSDISGSGNTAKDDTDEAIPKSENIAKHAQIEQPTSEEREKKEEILLYEEGITKEIIYKRNDGEVDGCLSYYKGIGAIIRTTVENFGVETVQCDITDAVRNDMLPDLVEGERAISFHIHIHKKYGTNITKKDEDFVKIFVPHRILPEHEEATLVCSVNGEDWEQCDLLEEVPMSLSQGIYVLGTELCDVTDVKLVAIAREKTVQLIVGEDDVLYQSLEDTGVSVKINTECFPARCGANLIVRHSQQRALASAVEIHNECRHILSCTAFVSLVCERVTTEDMNVMMKLPPGLDHECKFTIFLQSDSGWKLADCDWNKANQILTIHLTAGNKKYRVIGLELPNDMNVEDRLLAVHSLQLHTGHYTVRVMFRQKESDPSQAVVICLRADLVEQGIAELKETGYTIGGAPSEHLCLLDGDILSIECSGDITAKPYKARRMEMPFHSQKEIATRQITLHSLSSETRSEAKLYQGTLNVIKKAQQNYVVLAETIHIPAGKT